MSVVLKSLIGRCFFAVFIAVFAATGLAEAKPKYASIVIDTSTNTVLSESAADYRRYPASLTKMMTLYLTFEALDQGKLRKNERLFVSRHAASMQPAKLGLKYGQTIRVKHAILALVTKSANDVAAVLAESISGTEWDFSRKMTRKARKLGMKKTVFQNASGLHHAGQVTTARDMSILAKALIRDFSHYYEYFSTANFTYRGKTYRNHNKLLRAFKGMDGIKTGYIRASGFNLAGSAVRDDRRLVAIVMGGKTGKSRNTHMAYLLNKGFKKAAYLELAKSNSGVPLKKSLVRANVKKHKRGKWSIQVGTFRSRTSTNRAIHKALATSPILLADTTAAIVPLRTRKGRVLYRGRLVGLNRVAATEACNRLSDCLAISPRAY